MKKRERKTKKVRGSRLIFTPKIPVSLGTELSLWLELFFGLWFCLFLAVVLPYSAILKAEAAAGCVTVILGRRYLLLCSVLAVTANRALTSVSTPPVLSSVSTKKKKKKATAVKSFQSCSCIPQKKLGLRYDYDSSRFRILRTSSLSVPAIRRLPRLHLRHVCMYVCMYVRPIYLLSPREAHACKHHICHKDLVGGLFFILFFIIIFYMGRKMLKLPIHKPYREGS